MNSKRKIQNESDSATTEEEMEEIPLIDSADDMDPESFGSEDDLVIENTVTNRNQKDETINVDKWVVVEYKHKKRVRHFIGNILSKVDQGWEVKFLKCNKKSFTWPEVDDVDIVSNENIVKVLPNPSHGRRGDHYTFSVNFSDYNISF